MQFFRRSVPFLLGSVMAWGATNGCSGGWSSSPGDSADHVGAIGVELQIGSTTLDTLAYTITGPSSFNKSGTIDASRSATVSAVIGGLPAGNGYTITLTGTASDGVTSCAGSATFNVTAAQTTSVAIHLTCHEGQRTGGIIIGGTINVCPMIDGLSASPASARVGNTIAVSSVGHDSDHGPASLFYSWSTTSGTLSGAASQSPTFTCTTPGPATLTLALSDGDNTAGCPALSSITVNCEPQPQLGQAGHIIVIYQENHSFDNLFGSWPGAEGLSSPTANIPQIDAATGLPYVLLPQVDPNVPATLSNQPFDISQFVPANQKTVDLVHRFYQEQQQIDGGRMDKFVTVSDAKGLSFGYYPTAVQPIAALINSMPDQVALCDHFFHAAFGGSFLNHQWLIAAASPTFPGAPAAITATLEAQGNLTKDGQVTPDGYVVAIREIRVEGERLMPAGGPYLDPSDIALIAAWIDAGAM